MPKKPLKILLAASELDPLAKTGGLADVTAALAKRLVNDGHEVKVFLPKYKSVYQTGVKGQPGSETIQIGVGEDLLTARWEVYHQKPGGYDVVLVVNDPLFHRAHLYKDPSTGLDYQDNDTRFIFFSKATLEITKRMGWRPDVIHVNDWQTALIPAYLKSTHKNEPCFSETSSLLTIHNVAYQGIFDRGSFRKLGVGEEFWVHPSPFEYWGKVNFLKAGIQFADYITTVSERYAVEMQSTHEYGYGLEGVLRERNTDIHGILNGVDYDIWSPATDTLIAERYDADDLRGKKACKQAFLKKVGLPSSRDKALIGMITRLVDQKGVELFLEIADDILGLDVEMVVLGDGDSRYVKALQAAQARHPKKFKLFIGFDNTLAHEIEAACDIYLMPSRYEPCGLNQMYSLRYGAAPIVRETGGLADTIIDYSRDPERGVGFVFQQYSSDELLDAFCRALDLYNGDKSTWKKLITRGMRLDFSWERSTAKYIDLYRKAMRPAVQVA